MSETATVLIKQLVSKPTQNGNSVHKLIDGNGVEYATFKEPIFAPARQIGEGKQAVITFTEKTKDNGYTDRYLDKVEPAPEPEAEPKFGDGSYVKGKENPTTQRSIGAAVALQQAVATLNHTIDESMTPKDVAARVEPLASSYFLWLLRSTGTITDEDIPF